MSTLDALLEFSDAQAVTVDAISDVIDLNANKTIHNTLRGIGIGTPIYLVIKTIVTATSSGTPTVTFSLESDSVAALSSATVHFTSAAIALATLVAGFRAVAIALPAGKTFERFLGVRYDVGAGGPLTAGTFDAYLTLDVQDAVVYADNIN